MPRFLNLFTNKLSLDKTNVSQQTSLSTAVTCHSYAGVITTVSTNLAANGQDAFTVYNSSISNNSCVIANVCDYTGTGFPAITIDNVQAGSFVVRIRNVSDSAALNSTIKVVFVIL
jgi:hypothetical protein